MPKAADVMWGIPITTWNSVVVWATALAAVAGGLSVVSGFVAGFVGYKVSDVVQTQTALAIADANARADAARQASAEANARAAEANEKAESERLARAKIEERLAPRQLQTSASQEITSIFASEAGTAAMVLHFGDSPEIVRLSVSLANAIEQTKWKVGVFGAMGGAEFTGILVAAARNDSRAEKIAASLVAVLKAAGLEASSMESFDPADGNNLPAMVSADGAPSASDTQVRIFVGAK